MGKSLCYQLPAYLYVQRSNSITLVVLSTGMGKSLCYQRPAYLYVQRSNSITLVVLSTGMGKSLCYQLPAYLYAQRSNSITLVVLSTGMGKSLCYQRPAYLYVQRSNSITLVVLSTGMGKSLCYQLPAYLYVQRSNSITLVVLSTGMGKSLCYQLPAYPYAQRSNSITLVVLSTGMGKSLCYQLPAYLYAQRSNSITLVGSPLVSLMDDQLSGLPSKLKAAAIHSNMSKKQREAVKAGEVHVLLLSPEALVGGGHSGSGCLPPADQLPPVAFACIDEAHCVRSALDIAQHLDITDQDGIAVRSAAVPHNLQLSVSMDRDKDQALVSLLKGERFGSLESVIVYCTRRGEMTRISALLRTCLQGVLLKESNRTASQEEDDNPIGKKKKALGNYLFAFGDLHELWRHIYADTVNYYTVKKLVQKVFPPYKCRQIHQKQQDLARVMLAYLCILSPFSPSTLIGHEQPMTLLCYLELHRLLHPTLSVCKMVCYNGPQQLCKLTKICPSVAVVLARKRMAGERVKACDSLDFDVVEVADTMGWQLGLVKRGLRQLQWVTNRCVCVVLVEFSNLSFYFRSYGDLTPDEMDRVCEFLHGREVAQDSTKLYQLKACFKAFRSVAYKSCSFCTDELDERRSLKLKRLLWDYFDKRRDLDLSRKADIQSFLGNHSDETFSGRAVARIFHGIGSPCYPAQTFGWRYWRKYIQFDFNEIIPFAIQEIVRFK
uniref:RecQ helicase-like 4 n=1 Tax=Salmo trutta TaxID=8032 RepID=A0A674EIC5_SALTR